MIPQIENKLTEKIKTAITVPEEHRHFIQGIVKLLEDGYEAVHYQTGTFIMYAFSKEQKHGSVQSDNKKD